MIKINKITNITENPQNISFKFEKGTPKSFMKNQTEKIAEELGLNSKTIRVAGNNTSIGKSSYEEISPKFSFKDTSSGKRISITKL